MAAFQKTLALSLLAAALPVSLQAAVVNHTSVQGFDSIPQSSIDAAVAQNTIYFSHASIGQNITWGMDNLHLDLPTRYTFAVSSADDQLPSGGAKRGTFYEYYRGNIGWEAKVDTLKTYLDNGWGSQATMVINKLCYVDDTADWQQYAVSNANGTALAQLELVYPAVDFVYCTIPVVVAARNPDMQDELVGISAFNNALRTWTVANNKLLFDVADILSHDPAGNAVTFTYQGGTYESMYEPYANPDDYQHLGPDGYNRLAQGVYELTVPAVPEPTLGLLPFILMLHRRSRR